jgi:hypothetical protein
MELPALNNLPAIQIDLTKTKIAEMRLLETKNVNIATYNDLEFMVNDAYRELKKAGSLVDFQLAKTEDALEKAKATALLEKYIEFMKDKPKSFDNADGRKAFMALDADVQTAKDRVDELKAAQSLIDGRIKVMERVSAYMKKQMDLMIRSGMNSNIYQR